MRWSQRVTREGNALDLDSGVFTWKDPKRIAASLKRSAERSTRRKADPYRSNMSMLTFYLNRAGKGLSAERKCTLQRAKDELWAKFGRGRWLHPFPDWRAAPSPGPINAVLRKRAATDVAAR